MFPSFLFCCAHNASRNWDARVVRIPGCPHVSATSRTFFQSRLFLGQTAPFPHFLRSAYPL
ncbi:hypothetical protein BPSOL_0561 [Bifidobacterium pseudolongum]|nr:hypothetical protein BPSOL_0561 [Bifidobacterium pseudolongum]